MEVKCELEGDTEQEESVEEEQEQVRWLAQICWNSRSKIWTSVESSYITKLKVESIL